MATPEGKVKAKVKKLLDQYKAYYHMPVMNGMGKPSLDFVGCHRGRFYAIETKAGSKRPTERQVRTMQEMLNADGAVFLVNEVTGIERLEEWLRHDRPPF